MSDIAAEARFLDDMAAIIAADGLNEVCGRIIALLLISEVPVSFTDIAKRLRLSRSNVSVNIRLVETLKLARRIRRPGEREHYFQLSDLALEPFMHSRIAQLNQILKILAYAEENFSRRGPAVSRQLAERRRFYEVSRDVAARVLNELRAEQDRHKRTKG